MRSGPPGPATAALCFPAAEVQEDQEEEGGGGAGADQTVTADVAQVQAWDLMAMERILQFVNEQQEAAAERAWGAALRSDDAPPRGDKC